MHITDKDREALAEATRNAYALLDYCRASGDNGCVNWALTGKETDTLEGIAETMLDALYEVSPDAWDEIRVERGFFSHV